MQSSLEMITGAKYSVVSYSSSIPSNLCFFACIQLASQLAMASQPVASYSAYTRLKMQLDYIVKICKLIKFFFNDHTTNNTSRRTDSYSLRIASQLPVATSQLASHQSNASLHISYSYLCTMIQNKEFQTKTGHNE